MRYTPIDVTSTYASITALNNNFDGIATLFEKCVFTDGTAPNSMLANFDMNHFSINNVGNGTNPTDAVNLGQLNTVVANLTGQLNTISGFAPGNTTQTAGVIAKVDWVRNDDVSFPLASEGSIWPGKARFNTGINSTFVLGDSDAGYPCGTLFLLANANGCLGDVCSIVGEAVARVNNSTVFGGNVIARGTGKSGCTYVGLEIDVEPASGDTSISTNSIGLALNVFNKAVPGPAIHIGAASGGSFNNGIILEGLATTAAGLALGSLGSADSLINTSVGTFTTAAVLLGSGVTRGIKYGSNGGLNYYDGTNVRFTMPSGGQITVKDNANSVTLFNFTNNSSSGSFDIVGTGGQLTINGHKVLQDRDTGWASDTGTGKKTANATYSGTAEASYTQATIQTLMNALRDVSQTQKALKDALITHGIIGA